MNIQRIWEEIQRPIPHSVTSAVAGFVIGTCVIFLMIMLVIFVLMGLLSFVMWENMFTLLPPVSHRLLFLLSAAFGASFAYGIWQGKA